MTSVGKQLVMAAQVQRLTGLTPDQLREWTHRRRLIKPDSEPHGPGSRALYSWQTVLLLRLAVVLKESFHVELQAHCDLFDALSKALTHRPFHSLGGCALIIYSDMQFDITDVSEFQAGTLDSLILRLDPHLDVLSSNFDLVEPMVQFPLFAVAGVR